VNGPIALEIKAPAKINLFLRITGRRENGYHDLQSVFQFLSLCDDVFLTLRRDARITRTVDIPGVPVALDLMVRAAMALQKAANCTQGVDIAVQKRIPMGSGLGGGSSDAASVLLGLNVLWGLHWPPSRLAEIGLALGADVPVFVHGRAAWAEGVGEQLRPIEVDEGAVILALPDISVSTAEVFGAQELTRTSIPLTISGFPLVDSRHRMRDLMCAGNVCEPVVFTRYPVVARCVAWLSQYGPARMTGTGAACFAVSDKVPAIAGVGPWQVHTVRSLNRSPALAVLD
jgi:4-diphosphocytidyl-2-C-methyl-D-erythritol kinase